MINYTERYMEFLVFLLAISFAAVIIIFTLLCGFMYDNGMSNKWGGLRQSTIYSANITNYIICDSESSFDTYEPIVSFFKYNQMTSCVLNWKGGPTHDNCMSLNEIEHKFPYLSQIDLYLNTKKSPYCVTKDFLEENSYFGFKFLITDMAFLLIFVVTIVTIFYKRYSRQNSNQHLNENSSLNV